MHRLKFFMQAHQDADGSFRSPGFAFGDVAFGGGNKPLVVFDRSRLHVMHMRPKVSVLLGIFKLKCAHIADARSYGYDPQTA